MEAVYYIIISTIAGFFITNFLCTSENLLSKKENNIWLMFPIAFGTGTLAVTWMVYGISFISSVCFESKEPLFWGNICVLGGFTLVLLCTYILKKQSIKNLLNIKEEFIHDRKKMKKEMLFYGCLFLFISIMMFYVFQVKNGMIYSGVTVYGDYAPHTAMMRSFSMGENFPTQYPHFGGEDVKYHFMFQFLAGNLEYLGMRIDLAYNLVSIFSLWSFLVLLSRICKRLFGNLLSGCFAIAFFFFRSGTAFLQFLAEHMKAGDLVEVLKENVTFIGYTPNENWGLWNFNVYLNQRHLAFGLLIAAIVILCFLNRLEAGVNTEETGVVWLKNRLFSKSAWRPYNLATSVLCGMLLGFCSFWNGAAVIGGLLILFGMAIFSDHKSDYGIMAVITVIFSQIQSAIFVNGNVMDIKYMWGFISEDKSLTGVLLYLIKITGFFILGLLIIAFFEKRMNRCMIAAMFIPVIFTFTISLTPDVTVNHKYIMISYAFMAMFWGNIAVKLIKGNWIKKFIAMCLILCLTVTGIYDFVIILRGNDSRHRVTVRMDDNFTRWLENSMTKDDLVLTAEYSMNEITMSGIMMYCGWPYYAWSAGYDTYYRAGIAKVIFSTSDKEELISLVRQEGITYIIFEDGMTFEDVICSEELIKNTYPLVFTSDDQRYRVYKTDRIL